MLELAVDDVAHGGSCTARTPDGRVVFVRHTLPGERVRARITEQRSRYLRADAVDIVQASPDRVPPPCPYAGPGRCGGCDWQHVELSAQRRLKSTVIAEQFARLAGLQVRPEVLAVAGAPDGLGWRTRMTFAVRRDGVPGLRRHRSHAVQPIEHCRIAHPLLDDREILARRWPGVDSIPVAASAGSGDRVVGATGRRTAAAVWEQAAGRRWRVSAGVFWQVHPGAADALVDTLLGWLAPRAGDLALDLYCGVGLFAGALAERVGPAGRVLAVEGYRPAAADAAANLADLPQVEVRRARVDAGLLPRLVAAEPAVDLVVLDPPRAGAGREVATAVAGLRPRAVGYVACDPAGLARDVAAFGRAGYRLAELRALDMFPMTAHVECVALLVPDTA